MLSTATFLLYFVECQDRVIYSLLDEYVIEEWLPCCEAYALFNFLDDLHMIESICDHIKMDLAINLRLSPFQPEHFTRMNDLFLSRNMPRLPESAEPVMFTPFDDVFDMALYLDVVDSISALFSVG